MLHALASAWPGLGALVRPLVRAKGLEWLAETYRLTPGTAGNVWLMGGIRREHSLVAGLGFVVPPPKR